MASHAPARGRKGSGLERRSSSRPGGSTWSGVELGVASADGGSDPPTSDPGMGESRDGLPASGREPGPCLDPALDCAEDGLDGGGGTGAGLLADARASSYACRATGE